MGETIGAQQLEEKGGLRMTKEKEVTVLGAGYSGLTTAAELTLRGFKVRVVAADLGFRPPLTIVGTQSRRWPGSATSNTTFNNDDLLDRELVTIGRFIGLSSAEESGVKIVPALKVSRKPENTWNRRPLDEGRLSAASEVQRNMRMISQPKNVSKEDIDKFKATGYKTVDETQVVRIETGKYFKFLINVITDSGGSVEIGTYLTKEEVEQMKKSCHVVNCLGNNAGKVGGGGGEYYSNPGECVMWKKCPRNFGFYVMDDDHDAGVMQDPTTGDLYLSTAAKAVHHVAAFLHLLYLLLGQVGADLNGPTRVGNHIDEELEILRRLDPHHLGLIHSLVAGCFEPVNVFFADILWLGNHPHVSLNL